MLTRLQSYKQFGEEERRIAEQRHSRQLEEERSKTKEGMIWVVEGAVWAIVKLVGIIAGLAPCCLKHIRAMLAGELDVPIGPSNMGEAAAEGFRHATVHQVRRILEAAPDLTESRLANMLLSFASFGTGAPPSLYSPGAPGSPVENSPPREADK